MTKVRECLIIGWTEPKCALCVYSLQDLQSPTKCIESLSNKFTNITLQFENEDVNSSLKEQAEGSAAFELGLFQYNFSVSDPIPGLRVAEY